MTDDQSEISLFDIADWIWSFRWLLLACIAVAIGWTALSWLNTKAPPPSYDIKLQIFSGGTPVRGPGEIADILVAGIQNPGLDLVSAPSANPVLLRTTDSQLANGVAADVATLSDAMLAEVSAQEAELERLLPANENALPQYLKAKSFIEGVDSGLITPIVTTVTPGASSSSRLGALAIPVIASGFLFFLIAGIVSFASAWRKRHELG